MTLVESRELKKELNIGREAMKCLLFMLAVALVISGVYFAREPLWAFAEWVGVMLCSLFSFFSASLKPFFASEPVKYFNSLIASGITSILNMNVVVREIMQGIILFIGLLASCVTVKIFKSGQKINTGIKIYRFLLANIFLTIFLLIVSVINFKPGESSHVVFVVAYAFMSLIQMLSMIAVLDEYQMSIKKLMANQ
jgi:hypothetical protein